MMFASKRLAELETQILFLAMVRAGADRIGCSKGVQIIKALKQRMTDDKVSSIEIKR